MKKKKKNMKNSAASEQSKGYPKGSSCNKSFAGVLKKCTHPFVLDIFSMTFEFKFPILPSPMTGYYLELAFAALWVLFSSLSFFHPFNPLTH